MVKIKSSFSVAKLFGLCFDRYQKHKTLDKPELNPKCCQQRWSSWGLILKSLALASKRQALENCSILGLRTALFFELLEFCWSPEKFFGRLFFWRSPKNFFWRLFFFENTNLRLCLWFLALASSIPVLGFEKVCPRKGCPWIFLCPWPWPRALCPRLQLWLSTLSSNPAWPKKPGPTYNTDPPIIMIFYLLFIFLE